jgi:hypothetical protein
VPKAAWPFLALFAALAACADGFTPDCSGDAGQCGYQQPASEASVDAADAASD